jgi:hypothetical protein
VIRRIFGWVGEQVDARDCAVFGGLGMMGYGLYQYLPWVAFTVCGALLMLIGLLIGRTK